MKINKQEIMFKIGSFLAWLVIQIISRTTKFIIVGNEHFDEYCSEKKGVILSIWHGRIFFPTFYCRNNGYWAMISLSKDGELLAQIAERFGYQTVRGSTSRGAIKAALAACKKLSEGEVLVITPDGPRGPIHEIQDGAVFMSYRSNAPIIPLGVGMSSRKIAKSWDKNAIPLPFGKCALVFGKPVNPPVNDSESEFAAVKLNLKLSMQDAQKEAKSIVGEGEC